MMKYISIKKLLSTALAVSLLPMLPPATATGIPTVDASSITQAILQLEQLKREYEQVTRIYENGINQYNAISGIRNISNILNHGKIIEFMPDSLKTSIQSLGQYGAQAMTLEVRALYDKFAFGNRCNGISSSYQQSCYAKAAIQATRLYAKITAGEKGKEAMTELTKLHDEANSKAEDMKGGAELIAAHQKYQAQLDLLKQQYESSMKVLDEQEKIVAAKERERREAEIYPAGFSVSNK